MDCQSGLELGDHMVQTMWLYCRNQEAVRFQNSPFSHYKLNFQGGKKKREDVSSFLLVPDKERAEAGPVSEKFGLFLSAIAISPHGVCLRVCRIQRQLSSALQVELCSCLKLWDPQEPREGCSGSSNERLPALPKPHKLLLLPCRAPCSC